MAAAVELWKSSECCQRKNCSYNAHANPTFGGFCCMACACWSATPRRKKKHGARCTRNIQQTQASLQAPPAPWSRKEQQTQASLQAPPAPRSRQEPQTQASFKEPQTPPSDSGSKDTEFYIALTREANSAHRDKATLSFTQISEELDNSDSGSEDIEFFSALTREADSAPRASTRVAKN